MLSLLPKNKRGDTIVEVLISIAVVSLVLAGAFAASRQSVLSTQRNEERNYATRVLETQAERLVIISSDRQSTVYDRLGRMCINEALTLVGGSCFVSSPTGNANQYEVYMERTAANTFRIDVEWDRLGGDQDIADRRQRVTSFYKVYPG